MARLSKKQVAELVAKLTEEEKKELGALAVYMTESGIQAYKKGRIAGVWLTLAAVGGACLAKKHFDKKKAVKETPPKVKEEESPVEGP